MLDCCNKIYLGEFAHNEEKKFTGIIAEENGKYVFELKAFGIIRKHIIEFIIGDTLTLPSSIHLNEDAIYLMNIIDPSGEYISYMYVQCFTFKTVISLIDCETCDIYPYGITIESNINDDPDFELGIIH